jgi:hypothetical protein
MAMLDQRDPASKKLAIYELCDKPVSDSLPKDWVFSSKQCRYSLYKAVKEKIISLDLTHATEETRDFFAPLGLPDWKTKNASNFLSVYSMVHSDLAPIPKDELTSKLAVCFQSESNENQKCILAYISVLYQSGYIRDADALLEKQNSRLLATYGPVAMQTLSQVALEAKKADKGLRNF